MWTLGPHVPAVRPRAPHTASLSLGFHVRGDRDTGSGPVARITCSPVCRAPGLAPGTWRGGSSCFRPLLWAPLRAALWARLPLPQPSARARLNAICLGHQEPCGLQLPAGARGLTRRPPLPAPSPGTRRAPAGPQTPDGAGGAAGQDGAPGRRGCPQPATRHVITDPGNCCAEQSRVGRGTSAGGASENSAPGGY